MTESSEHLKRLLSKSVYAYMILPVPSIGYYKQELEESIEYLEKSDELDFKLSERDKGFVEIKAMTGEKDYTTDWDVLLDRINEYKELEDKTISLIDEEISTYKKLIKIHEDDMKVKDALMIHKSALEGFKESFEVMIGRKHYCLDCRSMFYLDESLDEIDCNNPYALPENGAPDIVSCEVNTCPYWEPKKDMGG